MDLLAGETFHRFKSVTRHDFFGSEPLHIEPRIRTAELKLGHQALAPVRGYEQQPVQWRVRGRKLEMRGGVLGKHAPADPKTLIKIRAAVINSLRQRTV